MFKKKLTAMFLLFPPGKADPFSLLTYLRAAYLSGLLRATDKDTHIYLSFSGFFFQMKMLIVDFLSVIFY